MAGRDLVGDLRAMPLSEVFQWIALSNKNGELHLQKEHSEVNIIFKNGKIVYVTSNIPNLLLGQLLLKYRMLSKNDLVRSLSLQKQLKLPIGQILIQHGLLNEKNVKYILEKQVEEIINYIVNWEQGFFIFEEKETRSSMISMSVDMLILEAMRRKDELQRFFKVFSLNSIIMVKNENHPLKKFIDGKRTVWEVARLVGGDYFETYEKIYSGIIHGDIIAIGEGEYNEDEDPVIKFIIGLELFNKNKIYESFKMISSIINSGFKNEQIGKFYENMVLHITRYFYKKFGGENTIFVLNRMRLLDEKIYIAPVEGFVLSRIEEYPTVSKLTKVLSISKVEIFLIIDKLYKLGLLHVGGSEKNKTEIMENNILNILLSIYKRQLTGELEVVSNNMSGRLFFEGGVLKFIYSTTPEYSLAKFFQEKDGFSINVENASDEISSVLIKYMEKNGYSFEKTKSIMEIYSNMIFYELLQGEVLSAIFIHESKFPINLGLDFNILFMLMLAVINNKLKVSNHINKNVSYELTRSEDNIEDEFDNIGLIKQLLANFSEGKLDKTKIAALSEYELSALNLLYSIGFIKEVEFYEISLEELSVYLNQIKAKAPHEIFEVDPDKYDIETVKQKFLKLSKMYHPDLITDKESKQVAREIFEIIKYAYDTLMQNVASETKKKVDIRNILLAEQLLSSGKVYMNMGRINDAIEAFIKSHNAFSDDEEITIYYGYALIRKGDYENGLKIISMIGVDKYEDPELYAALIESYIKLGKKAEAKRYLEKVLVKFPDKARRFSAFSSKLK